jgi:hypothetical protein
MKCWLRNNRPLFRRNMRIRWRVSDLNRLCYNKICKRIESLRKHRSNSRSKRRERSELFTKKEEAVNQMKMMRKMMKTFLTKLRIR